MLRALRTRTVRVVACALVVGVAATGCFAGPPGGTSGDLYHLVNRDRGGGLAWDGGLAGLAQEWAAHVAAINRPDHRNIGQIMGLGFRGAAENVIVFPRCNVSAAEIESVWMNSGAHRRNILGNYNAVGIGVACVNGRLGAVQDFGLR
jgi:Cysteine-rich secretory protein family